MSDEEISQEAKTALANAARRKAADRLARDGAHSMDAIRRRVQAIAQERNLQPADIAKLMHKRISTSHAVAFCEKHKISLDWLLCGDLQGLHRMTKEAKADPPQMTEAQRKEVTRLFLALSPQKAGNRARLHAGTDGKELAQWLKQRKRQRPRSARPKPPVKSQRAGSLPQCSTVRGAGSPAPMESSAEAKFRPSGSRLGRAAA
jgi:hypothetical protein